MRRLAALMCLVALPAFADTDNGVTLTIENDSGMVTQVASMTQRECDAAQELLRPRRLTGSTALYNATSTLGTLTYGNIPTPPSSRLATAKCSRSTDKP